MERVLNFGSLNLDYVYQVPHLVRPGETLQATGQQVNCGGKGLNQSIALAKAGMQVFHAGCVGNQGEVLKTELEKNGVDISCVFSVDIPQGSAMIQVDTVGENSILLYGGSNHAITEKMIDEVMEGFQEGDYLVLQNEVNCLEQIIEKGYAKGMKILLNPSPYEEFLRNLDYNKIMWLMVNQVEAEQISGEHDPDAAWNRMHEQYPQMCMVVTCGKEGAYGYTPEARIWQKACESEVVDTTGAGDTFTGYFLASLIKGEELEQSMKQGTVAAGISVSRKGAAVSIPLSDEVEDGMKRIDW